MKGYLFNQPCLHLFVAMLLAFSGARVISASEPLSLTIYKDANCGCCSLWAQHLERENFTVQLRDSADMTEVKTRFAIPPPYQSCHTAHSEVEGYVFEGHIPARIIRRFLAEKPTGARGLVVPGMPIGSPGMEMQDRFQPYQVMLLRADGGVELYEQVTTLESAN